MRNVELLLEQRFHYVYSRLDWLRQNETVISCKTKSYEVVKSFKPSITLLNLKIVLERAVAKY